MVQFGAFRGDVISIQNFGSGEFGAGCTKMIALQNEEGMHVNFVLTPGTFVVDQEMFRVGDTVTGYYDANAPAIAIYPPQYAALVMVKEHANQQVKVSRFNRALISEDNQLQLNLRRSTPIVTTNGQAFTGRLFNRDLIVIYGPSTKSVPAQTTPYRVIVLC